MNRSMETDISVERFIDCAAAADVLGGVHPKTVVRWAREGRIPACRYFRRWKFRAGLRVHRNADAKSSNRDLGIVTFNLWGLSAVTSVDEPVARSQPQGSSSAQGPNLFIERDCHLFAPFCMLRACGVCCVLNYRSH
jgi:hypothetical protein